MRKKKDAETEKLTQVMTNPPPQRSQLETGGPERTVAKTQLEGSRKTGRVLINTTPNTPNELDKA